MAERLPVQDNGDLWDEPQVFLRRRGIAPENGAFTERQLSRELIRRGWTWRRIANRVEAAKMLTPTGTVETRIVSDERDQTLALASILAEAIRFDDRKGVILTGPIDADIVVRAPDRRVIAIGEVKGGQSLSEELAARFRESLMSHATIIALAPFFLFIWPDVGYLWDQRAPGHATAPPTLTFSMTQVVTHYLPWLGPNERPGARELQLTVARWLDDLAHPAPESRAPAAGTFEGTDFLDAIQGATVITDSPE